MSIKLEDLEIYKVSIEIGEMVWEIVAKWPYFEKDTLGKQLVRAADSIAFNISEGYGRFYFKDNKMFNYYSRGSAKETLTGIAKAYNRKLLSQEEHQLLNDKLTRYFKLSFSYINSIGTTKEVISL